MIDVKKLFKFEGKHKGKVKVTRGGKTFYREQELGRKEVDKKTYDKLVDDLKQIKMNGDILRNKMNDMIDKYYDEDKISPENKKKIDVVENQMKDAYKKRDDLKKKIEGTKFNF